MLDVRPGDFDVAAQAITFETGRMLQARHRLGRRWRFRNQQLGRAIRQAVDHRDRLGLRALLDERAQLLVLQVPEVELIHGLLAPVAEARARAAHRLRAVDGVAVRAAVVADDLYAEN